MILVIPLSASDAPLAPDLAAVLTHLGPYRAHECVIMPTVAVVSEAETLKNQLAEIFGSAVVVPAIYNGEGWPLAPNRHFRECAKWVQANRAGNAWYFFEADNTPIKKGWLNALEAAYEGCHKLYMGAIVQTRVTRNTSAGPVYGFDGQHMVGTGIYPWNAFGRSIVLATCDQRYAWASGPLKPFDVQMGMEIVPYAAHTDLIAHRWRTVHYRYEGDRLVCDDQPNNPPGTSHAAPIPREAVVVHGCRDGSLARLVVANDAAAVKVETVEPTPPPGPTPFEQFLAKKATTPAPVQDIVLPDRETPPWTPPPTPQDYVNAGMMPPVQSMMDAPKTFPEGMGNVVKPPELIDRLRASVEGKGKRAKALAKELGVTESLVRRTTLKPTSGLRLVNGWVKPAIEPEPAVNP